MQYRTSAAFRTALCSLSLIVASWLAPSSSHAASNAATVLDGKLAVQIEDYADGRSRTRHFLETAHGRFELKFDGKATALPDGSRVRVRGRKHSGNVLALDATQAGSVEALSIASTPTMGEQRVAVLLVNFQDDASQPITATTARNLVFATVDAFYRENSFQQTWLAGDVHGWFNIPVSRTGCNTELISQQADQAAIAAGVDLSRYARKVYMFPANACTWAGLATVGGSPARAWINGVFNLRVVAHELGHTFGLVHAGGLNCDTGVLSGTCQVLTYGDAADLMGNRAAHLNASEKEQLGWLNDGVSPPIVTAAGSGRYSIEPYSASSVGTKAIKVPRGNDPVSGKPRWYYIEYRQPIGADTIITNVGTLTKGVLLRAMTEGDGGGSQLLDMTPDSDTSSGFADLEDGALALGRTYTDSEAGVTVTLAQADSAGAVIDIGFGGAPVPVCTRAAPVLTMTGSGSAFGAGTAASYSVSLVNRDSSACPATTFQLASSVPSGWTGALSAGSLSLSPGASATVTLTVTSPASATAGTYGVGIGAGSANGTVHTVSAASTYSVAAAPASLTQTIGTDKSSYLRGESVRISALVLSNGSPVAGAAVKFTVTVPGGARVVIDATSGSDGYARAVYKTGKAKSAIGSYALRADAAKGGATASTSTTFTVR